MSTKKLLLILSTCFLAVATVVTGSASDQLNHADVHRVMDQLLESHIEVREVDGEVLRRSYEVYLDQFDPHRIYLLDEEVKTFAGASPKDLHKALIQYQHSDLSRYAELNAVVISSIERARGWRRQLTAEAKGHVSQNDTIAKPEQNRPWARSVKELQQRQRDHLAAFAQRQIKLHPTWERDQTLRHAWALYNKRANALENPYLLRDGKGEVVSLEQQEHLLTLRTLKALAKSLDSHTAFYSPAEAHQMRMQLQQGFTGIGVVLEDTVGGVLVQRIVEGGPADKSGQLRVEDRIVEINGESITTDSFEAVMDRLRGPKGSTVVLGVVRDQDGQEKQISVALQRQPISLEKSGMGSSYEYFGDGIIGVIKLNSFYEGKNGVSSERDVRHAIREFQRLGNVNGIVLDMRENLGGFLSQAIKVAGLFISNGVVAMSKYGDGVEVIFREIDGHAYYDGPLVILTSKASASAAEIVAQALQDYGRALVVGDPRTYGKGSIQHQTITDETADTFYKVTVGRYYTVSGKSTQIKGVQADIVVPTMLYEVPIGEEYLEYPLAADQIQPRYDDSLSDLSPGVRRWYAKYYLPTLQKRTGLWRTHLVTLRKNSEHRIKNNPNYQIFLTLLQTEGDLKVHAKDKAAVAPTSYGSEDLQLEEATNILKDMIYLQGQ